MGILTLYVGARKAIEERPFLAACAREGLKLGIQVIVFTPEDVDHQKSQVRAHLFDFTKKRWVRAWRPLPRIIYDRCRYQHNGRFAQLRTFRRRYPNQLYLNHPMANKFRVQEVLERQSAIARFLPQTRILRNLSDLTQMSNRHSMLYVKPVNGTGGRGILRLHCPNDSACQVEGRNAQRAIIGRKKGARSPLLHWIHKHCQHGSYLLQQGIDNRLPSGQVYDFRLIVQKDGTGNWSLTGGGARVGGRRSITSNLHGGGRAVTMHNMLNGQFSSTKAQSIIDEMRNLSIRIAQALEKQYGRLCELGLDIAVDRNGHPWLLEVNPKPAREIFRKTGQMNTYRTAIRRPLEFARWLSK